MYHRCPACGSSLYPAKRHPEGWYGCPRCRHSIWLWRGDLGRLELFDRHDPEAVAANQAAGKGGRAKACDKCGLPKERIPLESYSGVGRTFAWRCLTPGCAGNTVVPPVRVEEYQWREMFPRRRLDNHPDEDDPLFEDVIRAIEDHLYD